MVLSFSAINWSSIWLTSCGLWTMSKNVPAMLNLLNTRSRRPFMMSPAVASFRVDSTHSHRSSVHAFSSWLRKKSPKRSGWTLLALRSTLYLHFLTHMSNCGPVTSNPMVGVSLLRTSFVPSPNPTRGQFPYAFGFARKQSSASC